MTDFTSLITGWFEAVQFRAPPAADLATFNAALNNGTLTQQQVQTAIIDDPFTVNTVDQVIREYQAAFGRVPDQAGLAFWVGQVAANPNALSTLSTTFANSPEFESLYGANASTSGMGNVALVTSLFTNVLGRAPDAAGLAFWTSQPLNAAQLLQAFAQSPEFITDTTSAVATFEQDEINGNEPISGSLFQPGLGTLIVPLVPLTTGNDNVTAQDITGTLTQFLTDGKGPTFNSGDVIKGSEPASTGNTLTITDQSPDSDQDIIPAGVSITNIQTIVLNTTGNAANWNTTPFVGVTSVIVNSTGSDTDFVTAAATTNVMVTHNNNSDASGNGITVIGGDNVTVIGGAEIVVGNDELIGAAPAGAVVITQTGNGDITVEGGTSVTISAVATAGDLIQVGDDIANPASTSEPTGPVTITDKGNAFIEVFGGTNVTITSAGGEIEVGAITSGLVFAPTGNVTITDTAATPFTPSVGTPADIFVIGGAAVNVTTNTGSVFVGAELALDAAGTGPLAGQEPTGNVTIVDTATNTAAFVEVAGGANVNVTASGLDVLVGAVVTAAVSGADEVVFAPTGSVTITDNAATVLSNTAGIGVEIDVIGGTTVSITSNTASSITVGAEFLNAAGTAFLAGQNPSGNVTIVDTATASFASVAVFGGANVNVSALGIAVTIGADEGTGFVSAPTGTITVANTAAVGFDDILNTVDNGVDAFGGTIVNITTNSGNVTVGDTTGDLGANPSGNVTIADAETAATKDTEQINRIEKSSRCHHRQ